MAANANFRQVLTVLALGVLANGGMATAASRPSLDEVRASFQHDGPRITNSQLAKSGEWEAVLDHIGKGEAGWIALAPQLATENGGAAFTEGLGIALATALPDNPVPVLQVTNPGDGRLGVQRVCGSPFVEPTKHFLRRYRREALAAVEAVGKPSLRGIRDACLSALRES